jgi:hypothetical protein
MTSSDSKIEKVQKHFAALSSVASSLNEASDELTKVVTVLNEALKKLNVGLNAWVTFRTRGNDNQNPEAFDLDQIGYCKVNGAWGIALRHIWGNPIWDEYDAEGPWLFNDAPRELRLHGVDGIPQLIEELGKEASDTTKKVHEKTQEVRELAGVIEQIANEHEAQMTKNSLAARAKALAKGRK